MAIDTVVLDIEGTVCPITFVKEKLAFSVFFGEVTAVFAGNLEFHTAPGRRQRPYKSHFEPIARANKNFKGFCVGVL